MGIKNPKRPLFAETLMTSTKNSFMKFANKDDGLKDSNNLIWGVFGKYELKDDLTYEKIISEEKTFLPVENKDGSWSPPSDANGNGIHAKINLFENSIEITGTYNKEEDGSELKIIFKIPKFDIIRQLSDETPIRNEDMIVGPKNQVVHVTLTKIK